MGAGLMGHGIALDFALAGFEVELQDVDETRLRQATAKIRATLQLLADAGRLAPGEVEPVGARVHPQIALSTAAARADRGIADPKDVDVMLQYGFGRRLAAAGVFEILDLVGLDMAMAVATALLPDLDASSQPPAGLREMIARGELGAKTGRGFYSWTPDSVSARSRALAQALLGIARLSDPNPTQSTNSC